MRTQVLEMRYYQKLLNISDKNHVTNEDVRWKIQASSGEYDEHQTETKVAWPRLKVFWLSKDAPVGHRERENRRRGGKTIIKSGQEWIYQHNY